MKFSLPKFCLYSGAAIMLMIGGCSVAEGPMFPEGGTNTKVSDSESILSAEGTWHIVENESGPTPLQQHMDAKDHVDPSKFAKNSSYVTNAKIASKGESVHYRLLMMEREVEGLRNDVNKLLPPLQNLIVSDQELDKTIEEIKKRNAVMAGMPVNPVNNSAQATQAPQALSRTAQVPSTPAPAIKPPIKTPSVAAAPKPISTTPAPAKTAPLVSSGPAKVSGIRMGAHSGGKTRIVMDLTNKSKFMADLDNNEKILLIDLPGTGWSAAKTQKFTSHPLVAGYTAQESGNGGTTLVIELKKPVKMTESAALPPRTSPPLKGHRIYLDIAPL